MCLISTGRFKMNINALKEAVTAKNVNSIEFIGKNELTDVKFTVDWKTVNSDETVLKMFRVPEITINGVINHTSAIKPIKLDFIAQEWDFINNEAFLIQKHDGFNMLFGDTPDFTKYANLFTAGGDSILTILAKAGIEDIEESTKEKAFRAIKTKLEKLTDVCLDLYIVEKKADSEEAQYNIWFEKPDAFMALGQRAARKAANFEKLFSDTADAGHAKTIINIMNKRKTK